MEIVVAWIVVAVAGLATLLGIFVLTRAIPILWVRSLLRCLSAVWLMLPWRIEAVDGYYAPAFIVAIFEGIFRADGNPRPALIILALATAFVSLIFLIAGAIRWARSPKTSHRDAAPVPVPAAPRVPARTEPRLGN